MQRVHSQVKAMGLGVLRERPNEAGGKVYAPMHVLQRWGIRGMSVPKWVESEIRNWVRWCQAGALPHPMPPDHCQSIECHYMRAEAFCEQDERLEPIFEERALVVQRVYDAMPYIERKVMQAEYLSPWRYDRIHKGVAGAARKIGVSVSGYESVLEVGRKKVRRAFS